jgi:hypothetical protein
MTDGEP